MRRLFLSAVVLLFTLPLTGSFLRKVILGLCSDSEGYLIGRDDAVRARAVADVTAFLNAMSEEN